MASRPDQPVAATPDVRVQREDFDAGREIAAVRAGDPKIGAVVSFIGLCRDVNDGETVAALTLEHYPGMTERAIESIVGEAKRRWQVSRITVIHRVGPLAPLDQIVLVIAAGAHRGEAFAACQFVMDYLKTRAPFWKKERTSSGEHWVEARQTDDAAAARWGDTNEGNPGGSDKA
jgi:molybdopterin synthase catalytic subunit